MSAPKENDPRERAATSTQADSNRESEESQAIEFATDEGEIYTPHPLTKVIPAMSAKDREALQADILKRELRAPILRHGNFILDGINRYEICHKFGIELRFEDYKGEGEDKDILAEIVSRNVPRRHLTTKQRAAIAAELANMPHGGDRRSDQSFEKSFEKVTDSEAAKLLNVSRSSVQTAKREKRKAKAAAPAKPRKPKPKKVSGGFEADVWRWFTSMINGKGMTRVLEQWQRTRNDAEQVIRDTLCGKERRASKP